MRASGLCTLLVFGCSTTSTIMRADAPNVEGSIVGGSRDSIFVADDQGGEHEIPRSDVTDVDYPGNVHANVGAVVLGYGLLNIAVGYNDCDKRTDDKAAFCTGVFLPAVIGAGMILWGLAVHQGQTSAFADTSRSSGLRRPEPRARFRKGPANMDGSPVTDDTDDDSDEEEDARQRPRRLKTPPAGSVAPAGSAALDSAPRAPSSAGPVPSAAPVPAPSAAAPVGSASYPVIPSAK